MKKLLLRSIIVLCTICYLVAAMPPTAPTTDPTTVDFTTVSTTISLPDYQIEDKKSTLNYSVVDREVPDLLKTNSPNGTVVNKENSPENIGQVIQLPAGEIQEVDNSEDDVERIDELVDEHIEVQVNESLTMEKISYGYFNEDNSILDGNTAAILAGCFLILSVVAYVGFLSWRRYLELRYGNRQMLINEDEFDVNTDNLKYFSI